MRLCGGPPSRGTGKNPRYRPGGNLQGRRDRAALRPGCKITAAATGEFINRRPDRQRGTDTNLALLKPIALPNT